MIKRVVGKYEKITLIAGVLYKNEVPKSRVKTRFSHTKYALKMDD